MSIPAILIYTQLNEKTITFGPVVSSVAPFTPIIGATVVLNLYQNRWPGTIGMLVAQFTDFALADIGGGVYSGTMTDPAFNPPVGANYTSVFDMTGPTQGHWEIPSQVVARRF